MIKIADIDCLNVLFEWEVKSVAETIKAAKEKKEHDTVLMGQAYVMGMQRAKDLINSILKDVQE